MAELPSRLDPEISPRQAEAFADLLRAFDGPMEADRARVLLSLHDSGLAPATVDSILKDAVNYGILIPIRQKGRTAKILAYRVNPFFAYWEVHHGN